MEEGDIASFFVKDLGLALVLWYGLGRPVVTLKIGNWTVFVLFGWRFVFGIIMR